MGFEKRPRPSEVDQAIKSGDQAKINAFAKAGGNATAQRWHEIGVGKELNQELHEDSMREAADQRRDDLLPADD